MKVGNKFGQQYYLMLALIEDSIGITYHPTTTCLDKGRKALGYQIRPQQRCNYVYYKWYQNNEMGCGHKVIKPKIAS